MLKRRPRGRARFRTATIHRTICGAVRCTDRLFHLIQLLPQPPPCRDGILARGAAGSFGAHRLRRRSRSDRLGNPIEGEAGVGYRLRPEYNLPTFMLTRKRSRRSCSGQRFGLPRARRETGCHAPGRRPRSRTGERWTSRKAGATPGSERASPPRRGIPGLDSGSLRWPLFRCPHGPVSGPLPALAQTWHSKIEIRDQNRK